MDWKYEQQSFKEAAMAVGVGAFTITANAAQPAVEFVPGEYIVKLKEQCQSSK